MSFWNYKPWNRCLCKCLKRHFSVQPTTINMLKGRKHCRNLHDSSFISFGHQSGKNLSWKKFFLVVSEILRSFFNILTPDENYFLRNRQNLPQPTQMKLSKKIKIFSQFSTDFGLKTGSNTAVICTMVVLTALFVTLGKFQLEQVFLSNIWNLKTVC